MSKGNAKQVGPYTWRKLLQIFKKAYIKGMCQRETRKNTGTPWKIQNGGHNLYCILYETLESWNWQVLASTIFDKYNNQYF